MRAGKHLRLVVFLSIVSFARGTRISISPDGGYNDIVIKIKKNVPEESCRQILGGIKDLLDQSSELLNNALFGLAFFSSATVVVPASWRDKSCGVSIKYPDDNMPYNNADMWISKPHPFHGYYPFTQQSGGCGKSGDFISIPHTFVTSQNITHREAKTFVHQWSKFRYGIFDEMGFSDDRLYPSSYIKEGKSFPTVSHNGDLTGIWLRNGEECSPEKEPQCFFVPDTSNDDVTCSLGNGLNLRSTIQYCNSSEYNLAPTKHSVLCEGRSALDVILSHIDFHKVIMDNEMEKDLRPEIRIVREPSTKYVLAIETSASMSVNDNWRWIHKAAHKFIRYDLPVNSNLAILTFSAKVKIEHPLVQVTSDAVRARLADTIPGKYHLSTKEDTCIGCALEKTLDEVVKDNVAGTHFIIVTSGNKKTPNDHRMMEKYAQSHQIKISSILIPSTDSTTFYDNISQKTGGRSFQLSDTGYGMDLLYDLNKAFSQILKDENVHPSEAAETVHVAEYYSSDMDESDGAFIIDASLGRDTIFGIYVEDEEDHLIKSVKFEDSDGNVYGPFTKMSSAFDPVNIKTINYVGETPPFGNPNQLGRNWYYSIKWSQTGSQTRKSIVTVTSKPRTRDENQLVWVNSWTTHDRVIDGSEPVAVFAQVHLGSSPVINASVLLDVEVENENGTIFALLPISMQDNGRGEPDLISFDGVYSTYITSYPSTGRYKFTVRVEADDLTFTFPQGEIINPMPGSCCGSSTNSPQDKMIKTGIFSRTITGPVLNLDQIVKQDVFPPAKIVDLTVISENSGIITAVWTSPGGDYLAGSVAGYKFVYSSDIADLLDKKSEPEVLKGLEKTQLEGTLNEEELHFPFFGRDYYIGVVPFDSNGNYGKISNLVHVFQTSPITNSQESTTTSSLLALDLLVSDKDWIMVGVLCGIFAVLIIITTVSLSYFCWLTKKKKSSQVSSGSTSDVNVVSSGSSDQTDASSFDLDMKNFCSNNATPSYDNNLDFTMPGSNIRDSESPPRDHDMSSTRVTPIYWSASQLLSKLDEGSPHPYSYQNESYGYPPYPGHTLSSHIGSPRNASSVRGPPPDYSEHRAVIPDEFCVTVSDLHYSEGRTSQTTTVSDSAMGISDSEHRENLAFADETGIFRHSHRVKEKMPPPLFPKPKNITQV